MAASSRPARQERRSTSWHTASAQEPRRVTTRQAARERSAMAGSPEEMRARIEAYPWPPQRGGVEVVRANRGYTLYSQRTGGPVARLRPTGQGDTVQVLWWRREAWAAPGDVGPVILPLDQALEFITSE